MNLKDVVPSKNLKDNTTTLVPPARPFHPAIEYFWRQMHMHPNDDSSIPRQTNPNSNPMAPPGLPSDAFPIQDLSDEEISYIKDYGFNAHDILLLRHMNTTPGQVMEGWKLQQKHRNQSGN